MRSIAVFATVAGRTHGVKSICCADARTATCYAKRMTLRAAGKYPRLLTNGVLWRAAHLPSLDTMLTGVDPYRVLQVVPDAEPEVIQAAYRALVRKHHPDVGGSEVQMAMLNAAWETLRDERERERYDLGRKTDAAQPTPSEPSAVNQRPFAAAPSTRPMSPRAHSGTVLDYGRYAGFSLGELAIQDRNYLEWLARTPMGRRLQHEIETILTPSRPAAPRPATLRPAVPRPTRPRLRFLHRQ